MQLHPIFASNMVFAAGKPILIYGTGCGSCRISFAGQTKTVTSQADTWEVEFPAMPYGGPYELLFNETRLCNIYVGQVYLCAGQSNMEFRMCESATPRELYQPDSRLRLFTTVKPETSRFSPTDGWVLATEDTIPDWSCLAYLTARELAEEKDIAIGVLSYCQGATSIESFLPKGAYEKLGIQLEDKEKHPGFAYKEPLSWHYAGSLYSLAFHQVTPFPVTGVIWYQGEANTCLPESKTYIRTLAELIKLFRSQLRDPQLPFYVIQLADYDPRNDEGWRTVQAAQLQISQELPYVSTVICADVCESHTIHPPTKQPLAHRLAKLLLKEIS